MVLWLFLYKNMIKNMQKNKSFIVRLMSLAVVILVLATGAILRDGKIFGHDLRDAHHPAASALPGDTLSRLPDGSIIVDTKPLAKDVPGYGGPVPLRIHIGKDGIVGEIETLPNAESPDFFNRAKSLLTRWQGKTVDEAAKTEVDGVSGATFSSKAIIENMRRGLTYAQRYGSGTATDDAADEASSESSWTLGGMAALMVVLLGAVVPLFTHNRRWHDVQLALNIIVLGLWTGTFISYALFMRLFAEGVSLATLGSLAAPLMMVIIAWLYPLAGRQGHYCAHICPFGSAQELAGKLTHRKPRIPPRLNKGLTLFRSVLWGVLMALMLTGTWTAWMDYELFTAFLYTSAPVWVTVIALLFLVVSVWVPRPYCRFVCPTGMIIKN